MRLLVLAQAVDRDDALFGFFVDWLKEAKNVFSRVIVLALRVDRASVPEGVTAMALQDLREPLFAVAIRLWRVSWRERHAYDGVFVRGDAIYLVLVGWLWRLLGKRVVFWYTHYRVTSWLFWVGQLFAHEVVTATKGSNPLRRARVIGHHIPEAFFQTCADGRFLTPPLRALVLGRLSPVKRVPDLIRAISSHLERGDVWLDVIGPGTDEQEEQRFEMVRAPHVLRRNDRVRWEHLPHVLSDYDMLLSATPGSMDKVILEAAATGMIVIATSSGWHETVAELPEADWLAPKTIAGLHEAVEKVLVLPAEERVRLGQRLSRCVKNRHLQSDHLRRLRELFVV